MIDPTKQPGIRITQVFLERAHFEHRSDFLEYPPDTAVNAEVGMSLGSGLSSDSTKAKVQITVSTKDDTEPLYRFSFQMTALLEVEEEAPNFPLPEYVRTNAFGLLLPFVRELVANVTSRGRFGPLWIKPVNVIALAAQHGQAAVQGDSPSDPS